MELPIIFRQLQWPLMFFVHFVAMGFRPGFFRIFLTLPPLLLLWYQSLYRKEFMYYGDQYPINVGVTMALFNYLDQVILANPDREGWHRISASVKKKDDGKDGGENKIPQTYLKRVWWCMRYFTTTRFVGWSQQVKNVPIELPADYPRW